MRFSVSVKYFIMMLGCGLVSGVIAGISIGLSMLLGEENYVYIMIGGQYAILVGVLNVITDKREKSSSFIERRKNALLQFERYDRTSALIVFSIMASFLVAHFCAKWVVLLFGDIVSYIPVYLSLTVMMLVISYFKEIFIRVRIVRRKR